MSHRPISERWRLRGATVVGVTAGLVVVLAACSENPAPTGSATSTTTTRPSTSSVPTSTTNGTLSPETPTETEFLADSGNISCEIDYNFGSGGESAPLSQTLCLTINPARSVVLKTDGSLTECTGQQCLSNAGENTPTLSPGQSIALGPFTCLTTNNQGVRCTETSGQGFLISTHAGVTPVGGATVTSS